MSDPNRRLLESAADLLRPLLDELVFVGGCATGLLITDTAAGGIRPTFDVDTVTPVASYTDYVALADRLRRLGLTEDVESGVICRWRKGDILIDVMPTDGHVLGFTNRWYRAAIASATAVDLGNARIRLITAPCFLATKLDAFHGRGAGDVAASHDLEDAIAVIDGRAELPEELNHADTLLRDYIADEMRTLLRTRAFVDALPGMLLPDAATQARLPLVLGRLRALAASAG